MYQSLVQSAVAPQVQEPVVDYSKLPFPLVDSPFFEAEIKSRNLTPGQIDLLRAFRKDGYLIASEGIVDKALADRIENDVIDKVDKRTGRLQDAWRESEVVRSLSLNEQVLSLLRLLYGREPVPFQTLNFVKGTEQATHSDAIHFNTLPRGFLAGVWVALEDITVEQGPLHYYPESHRLPEFDYYDLGIARELLDPEGPVNPEPSWEDGTVKQRYRLYEQVVAKLVQEHGFERKTLTLRQGDFLIWAANLFHGGNPILKSGSTRKSQVTHYHFEGVIPWTPHFSNARMGRFYIPRLVDLRTLKPLEKSYNFSPVELTPLGVRDTYSINLTGASSSITGGATSVGYYEELARLKSDTESLRAENQNLEAQLKVITSSRLWKAIEPLRNFRAKVR